MLLDYGNYSRRKLLNYNNGDEDTPLIQVCYCKNKNIVKLN